MIKYIGKKIGMIQIYDKRGELIPVTIIKIIPATITVIRNFIKLKNQSIQIGYNLKSKFSLTKPELGHFLKHNLEKYQFLKEFNSLDNNTDYKVGDSLDINNLEIGVKVKIQGKSIGKGNTGNIKKHSFNRGPMGHGSKHHRLQGSMGSGTTPGRVFPGKRMPGRLGGTNVTISNLQIIDLDKENCFVFIKGSTPGKKGNILTITI